MGPRQTLPPHRASLGVLRLSANIGGICDHRGFPRRNFGTMLSRRRGTHLSYYRSSSMAAYPRFSCGVGVHARHVLFTWISRIHGSRNNRVPLANHPWHGSRACDFVDVHIGPQMDEICSSPSAGALESLHSRWIHSHNQGF